jgi:uncharacterized oxidoreductase
MTQALRYQLADAGVRVVEVMPPALATAMSAHYSRSELTPEQAEEAIHRGLLSGCSEVVIGTAQALRLPGRIAPRLAFNLIASSEERMN